MKSVIQTGESVADRHGYPERPARVFRKHSKPEQKLMRKTDVCIRIASFFPCLQCVDSSRSADFRAVSPDFFRLRSGEIRFLFRFRALSWLFFHVRIYYRRLRSTGQEQQKQRTGRMDSSTAVRNQWPYRESRQTQQTEQETSHQAKLKNQKPRIESWKFLTGDRHVYFNRRNSPL